MEPVLVKVSSADAGFQEFYESLAQALSGGGTVFTPYPVIPPNARVAVPPPTEVLVELRSDDSFGALYRTVSGYLGRGQGRSLRLERGAAQVDVRAGQIPDERSLRGQLMP